MNDTANCGNCRFWSKLWDESGYCMRYAPGRLATGQFPQMDPSSWCGEHEPRDDSRAPANQEA
jgi:hypothetical protein